MSDRGYFAGIDDKKSNIEKKSKGKIKRFFKAIKDLVYRRNTKDDVSKNKSVSKVLDHEVVSDGIETFGTVDGHGLLHQSSSSCRGQYVSTIHVPSV